ncbi:MAG: TldD/PmbA family protein, partial [Thermodesulfobacteriota bacterium]
MNIEKEEFFKDFDPFRIIREALKCGGDFADLYFEDTMSTSIILEDDKLEKVIAGRDRGCGLRVIHNLKTHYAYTNDLTRAGLMELAGIVSGAVKAGVQGEVFPVLRKVIAPRFGIKVNPASVALIEKIALVKIGNKAARAYDKRVRQVKCVYGDGYRDTVVLNSNGERVEENKSSLLFVAQVVADDGKVVQTGYEPIGGTVGFELFDDLPPDEVAVRASERAVKMLRARKAPGGTMSVVLSSEAGGTMIHEAIGHGLEADLAEQGLSVYSGKLGEKVAGSIITVIDDATIPLKRGSSFFDGEGTPTERTVLVEGGVLKSYMHDRLSAMRAGGEVKSTGNGRRESYHFRPIPRMTNTLIAPGESNPDDILSSLDSGLFVK